MLTVTPNALELLSGKLAGKNAPADAALRFRCAAGRWKMRVDLPQPDDAVFTHGGRKVLVLDQVVATALSAMTLIVRKTSAGLQLKLRENSKM